MLLYQHNYLFTLSYQLKSYATGDSEVYQGYVVYYTYTIAFHSYFIEYLLIVLAQLAVAFYVAFFLGMRLNPADNVSDTIVTKVFESIAAAFSSQSNASHEANIKDDATEKRKSTPKNKTEYLTLISNREYISMYALLVIGFIIWDSVIYCKANKKSPYWRFFPIPFLFIESLLMSIICTFTRFFFKVKFCIKTLKKQCLEHWQEYVAMPFLTILSAFVISHGFWILLMFLSFPALVISKMIFFIPLSLPVIIMLQRIFSCFRLCCRYRSVPPKGYFSAGFCFFILWSPVLVLLYATSNYFLDVSEISNDPLKLIMTFLEPFSLLTVWPKYGVTNISKKRCFLIYQKKKKKKKNKNKAYHFYQLKDKKTLSKNIRCRRNSYS